MRSWEDLHLSVHPVQDISYVVVNEKSSRERVALAHEEFDAESLVQGEPFEEVVNGGYMNMNID
ncbi:hypothetical protein NDI79_22395 [Halogeometricum sp. S3BR5-2]|uniref:Uncharacterized protein n=1 Tax=Halogeometricum luteum TaxID=2950537 RepID=A0ABU2G9P3_9EURY|nr:hypothetical protein [Halogeometricum sp. S3BR5-2]MDS0296919.1 hypothetical protein [Halogeometricum sp. S3BR5-2]